MPIATKEFLDRARKIGRKYSDLPSQIAQKPEEEEPEEFDRWYKEGDPFDISIPLKYSGNGYRHPKKRWKDKSDEEKMRDCTQNTGQHSFRKLPNGHIQVVPINCNLCPACFALKTGELKARVDEAVNDAKKFMPDGKWYKKTVERGTESDSLKKKINRNQHGRHMEIINPDDETKMDVYALINENKTNSDYGEYQEAPPNETIDFKKTYELKRKTKTKLSFGKGLKKLAPASKKENEAKIQVALHDIKVEAGREDEAKRIIEATNYLEEADTAEKAHRLFLWQFRFILRELQLAGIAVSFIRISYVNMTEAQLLADWNSNVKFWMSVDSSFSLDGEAEKPDTDRLYYSNNKKTPPEKTVLN